jgi:hypothetical protein
VTVLQRQFGVGDAVERSRAAGKVGGAVYRQRDFPGGAME